MALRPAWPVRLEALARAQAPQSLCRGRVEGRVGKFAVRDEEQVCAGVNHVRPVRPLEHVERAAERRGDVRPSAKAAREEVEEARQAAPVHAAARSAAARVAPPPGRAAPRRRSQPQLGQVRRAGECKEQARSPLRVRRADGLEDDALRDRLSPARHRVRRVEADHERSASLARQPREPPTARPPARLRPPLEGIPEQPTLREAAEEQPPEAGPALAAAAAALAAAALAAAAVGQQRELGRCDAREVAGAREAWRMRGVDLYCRTPASRGTRRATGAAGLSSVEYRPRTRRLACCDRDVNRIWRCGLEMWSGDVIWRCDLEM